MSQMTIYKLLQQKTQLTRREITENKIAQNIFLYNDPREMINHDHLLISTKDQSKESLINSGNLIMKQIGSLQGPLQVNSQSMMTNYQTHQSKYRKQQNSSSVPKI